MEVYNRHHNDAPAGAVYVGRPTTFGNPFEIGKHGTREEVVAKYEHYLQLNPSLVELARRVLRGKSLICYCAPLPCHADVLLRIANK